MVYQYIIDRIIPPQVYLTSVLGIDFLQIGNADGRRDHTGSCPHQAQIRIQKRCNLICICGQHGIGILRGNADQIGNTLMRADKLLLKIVEQPCVSFRIQCRNVIQKHGKITHTDLIKLLTLGSQLCKILLVAAIQPNIAAR